MTDYKSLFRIRVIACFVHLKTDDFHDVQEGVEAKIRHAAELLTSASRYFQDNGYEVQTVRIVTNSFTEWLENSSERLQCLDNVLIEHGIEFAALGSATREDQLETCQRIIAASHRFSCSFALKATDDSLARAAAQTILNISRLEGGAHVVNGLGNFRFAIASCVDYIPFFPVAQASSNATAVLKFALGFENGCLARHLLSNCQSISNISTQFKSEMADALSPIQSLCESFSITSGADFVGMDTSLNPSLDVQGSVASAMEQLIEVVSGWGGPGTVAAATAITLALQSLPGIRRTGYCGLMLPLCEDHRLAQLANAGCLNISDLLMVSSVCGVGVDTVPIPGDCSPAELSSLLLDVVGLAERWNKSLSCRVFPVPGKQAGEFTTFESPYMINSRVLSLAKSEFIKEKV
jgi:uncharacterized protein